MSRAELSMPDHTSTEPLSSDDVLPPVQPPSAGFIVQLFLVPAVIVGIIVVVFLGVDWLAHMGGDPTTYVEALKRRGDSRWHAAVNLANALSGKGNESFKRNSQAAAELAGILREELESGPQKSYASSSREIDGAADVDRETTLEIFLCKALGEFYVDDGLPVLVQAAGEQGEPNMPVRIAALEAIAVLARNMEEKSGRRLSHPQLEETLLAASQDDARLVRSTAAFTLGVVGGERLLSRLEAMLGDEYPDARFNAATGLARHGRPEVIPVLEEMLNPDQSEALASEAENARPFKRSLIIVNGLRATRQLADANAKADLTVLAAAADRLLTADVSQDVQQNAIVVSQELKDRSAVVSRAGD